MSGPAAQLKKFAAAAIRAAVPLPPSLCNSAIQAVAAPAAKPLAKPLNARATNSHPVPAAKANTRVLAMPTPIAGRLVMRRPI